MGYFANGTEGELYQAQWCERCVHWQDDGHGEGCPIFDLHLLYNYDQLKKESTRRALEMLIPSDARGGNGRCRMFWERGSGRGGGEPILAATPLMIVRAA